MSTFKGKLGTAAVCVVLFVTIVFYLVFVHPRAALVADRAQRDVTRAAELVQRIQRLHAYDLVALAKEVALRPDLSSALSKDDETERRRGVFEAISEYDRTLREQKRKAHFLAVVDAEGRVVARDLNIENMYGEKLPYPSIARALAGEAASDVWFMYNRMMRSGAAPILVDGEIKGATVIAYDFTAAEARREAKLLQTDVVYFMDKSIRASSFQAGSGEDSAKVKRVGRQLMAEGGPAAKALQMKATTVPLEIDIQGKKHLAVVGPLPEAVTIVGIELTTRVLGSGQRAEKIAATTEHRVGFAVLVNLEDRLSAVTSARYSALLFGGVLLLIVFAVMWTVARHFVNAEDRLELGVNEVINGDMDYTFDALQEFEGLANALNVMLARLLGRPEPGEEEDSDSSWRPDVLNIEELDPAAAGVDVQQLAAEEEGAYHDRLYQQYIEARRGAGLSIDGISQQDFLRKLTANEAMLRAKHKCDRIRFQVHSEAGRVGLRPVRLG